MRVPVGMCLAIGAAGRSLFRFQEPTDLLSDEDATALFEREKATGRRFLERFPQTPGSSVLELGCGFGGMLVALQEAGAKATGVDTDDHRASFARERGLPALTADAQALPFPEASFDAAISYAVLEHIPDIRGALAESWRVLRSGGRFFATWGPAWLTYNGPHLVKALGVPWVHLLFSDATIIGALEEQKRKGAWPASYLDYKIADFRSMGRTTRQRLRDAASSVGFAIVEESSHSPHPVKHALSQLPLLDELLAGELAIVLRKP